jgi:hypothetical protein
MNCGDRDTKMETKERKILLFPYMGNNKKTKIIIFHPSISMAILSEITNSNLKLSLITFVL